MRKALVVGINNYGSNSLKACVNDANAVADVLKRHGDRDLLPNFEIIRMPASSEQKETVGRSDLRGAIETLFTGACDIALFYFSGHGFITSTGGYIVTSDFKKYNEGVSMDEIMVLANQSSSTDKIIVLDCCHAGSLGSPSITGGNIAQLSEGLTVLAACQKSESAIEVDGRSIFTALVVDALKGGAADLRGYITTGSIYAYVDQALGALHQRPVFKTNITRFTSIRNVSPPVPYPTLRKLCDYFPTPQKEHKLDPSYEFTEPSANPEKVPIFKDLQVFARVGLVVPVGEEHMYYAAMNSRSCRLTALGYQYWRLVKDDKI